MSNYVDYSEDNKNIWISYIKKLLNILYTTGDILLFGLVLQQIYEYSVWFVQNSGGKPFNVKDLFIINPDISFKHMCQNLCQVRNIATHQPYNLSKKSNKIVEVLSSECFKELLVYVFKDDASMFDEMLSTYSRWLYE